MQVMRNRLIAVATICFSFVGMAAASASCSSVTSCNKSEFKAASTAVGCGLLFLDTRNTNCLEAGKSLHSAVSCGLVNQAPPVCANDQNNRAILMRLRPCLKDRTQQQEAFASGLNDVSKAEKVKFPRDQAIEIKAIWS